MHSESRLWRYTDTESDLRLLGYKLSPVAGNFSPAFSAVKTALNKPENLFPLIGATL